jgi:hypothetical protein
MALTNTPKQIAMLGTSAKGHLRTMISIALKRIHISA